jgi:hypothetical protein
MASLADLLKHIKETGQTLSSGYPRAKGFADALMANVERNVPTTQELQNPVYMQQRALNYMSPMAGAIKAYHGTPHKFDRFDMSKIGTGEGAQAYGHGLYFAENPKVAEEYRDELSRKTDVNGQTLINANKRIGTTGDAELDDYLIAYHGDINKALSESKIALNDYIKNAEKGGYYEYYLKESQNIVDKLQALKDSGAVKTGTHGAIYETSIQWPDAARESADPLSEHHLLDWDKPFDQQSDYIKNLLSNYGGQRGHEIYKQIEQVAREKTPVMSKKAFDNREDALNYFTEAKQGYTGKDQFKPFVETDNGKFIVNYPEPSQFNQSGLGPVEDASNYLNSLGIPGIKYLDQGSRTGGGTSNYVMFGDEYPQIVNRANSLAELLRGK